MVEAMLNNTDEEIVIPESAYELLATNHIATMSMFRRGDGFISTTPVGYVWDGKRIRVSTLKSRMKYKNLVADPRITLCIVSRLDITRYIELRGHATIQDDIDRRFWRLQFKEGSRIMRGLEDVEPPEDLDPVDAERVIITIHPEKTSIPALYDGRLNDFE